MLKELQAHLKGELKNKPYKRKYTEEEKTKPKFMGKEYETEKFKKGGKALKKGKSLKNTKPAFKNTKGGLKNTKGGIKSTKGKPKKDRGWKKDLSPKVVINDASTWKKGRSLKGKSKLKRS